MNLTIDPETGLVIDADDRRPVAHLADSFITALGDGAQAATVILRLYQKGDRTDPPGQAHQFALPAQRAGELGRHLLELAAQAEKDAGAATH